MLPLEPDDLPRGVLIARRLSGLLVGSALAQQVWAWSGGAESPGSAVLLALFGMLPALVLGFLLGGWAFEAAWRQAVTDLDRLEHMPVLPRIVRTFLRMVMRLLLQPLTDHEEVILEDLERRPRFAPRRVAYRGSDDRERLRALLSDAWRRDVPHQHLHPGDLSWRLRPQPGRDPHRDLTLVEDRRTGEVLGFAWLDGPDQGDLWVRPGRERDRLEDQLLTWMEQQATERGAESLTVGCCDGDPRRRGLLEERGYAPTDEGLVQLVRPLDAWQAEQLPRPQLPPGYELRPLVAKDFTELGATVAAAFGTAPKPASAYETLFADPFLRRDLCLGIRAPDGALVAFAFGWFDEPSRTGHVEPLGTQPDHQRRGLGRALLRELVRRLTDKDARSIGLSALASNRAARDLYETEGFVLRVMDRDWTRPLEAAAEDAPPGAREVSRQTRAVARP